MVGGLEELTQVVCWPAYVFFVLVTMITGIGSGVSPEEAVTLKLGQESWRDWGLEQRRTVAGINYKMLKASHQPVLGCGTSRGSGDWNVEPSQDKP